MAWYTRHPEVVYTDLEDGAVLLHMETKFYYSLNESGQAIWGLLDAVQNDGELIDRLKDAYETGDDLAEPIKTFLGELEKEKLVVERTEENQDGPSEKAQESPGNKKAFTKPEVIKHDEPLHEVVLNPFDPQLPLAE